MDVVQIHPLSVNHIPTLDEKLDYFRNCSPEDISGLVTVAIPEDRLPLQYLKSLSNEDRTICYRAAMICWDVTQSTIVPREMQFCGGSFTRKDAFGGIGMQDDGRGGERVAVVSRTLCQNVPS
jgi:hypothetical protein